MAFFELVIEMLFGLLDRSFVPLGVFASRLVTRGRPHRDPEGIVANSAFGCLGLVLLLGGAVGIFWLVT